MSAASKKLIDLLGPLPEGDSEFRHRQRVHQAWWRLAVLAEEAGPRPGDPSQKVANTLPDANMASKNFISAAAQKAYDLTKEFHKLHESGIIIEGRLLTNLLSSQPLCFNFFGELKLDLDFAGQVLRNWVPGITSVEAVHFEYGLPKDRSLDKSAFDVAFLFQSEKGRGLLGLECKYTDDFSGVAKDRVSYRRVFEGSKGTFRARYEDFFVKPYHQLFRNQLIAEVMRQRKEIDYAITGIFCHQEDENALQAADGFQREMLANGQQDFRIITYRDFITAVQRGEITWERREWLMLLWARYCGTSLSRELFLNRPSHPTP